jgi:hypothetical protein
MPCSQNYQLSIASFNTVDLKAYLMFITFLAFCYVALGQGKICYRELTNTKPLFFDGSSIFSQVTKNAGFALLLLLYNVPMIL